MKKYLFSLIPLAMLSFQPASSSHPIVKKTFGPDELQPTATQEKTQVMIAQILTQYHYNKVALNNEMSSKIYDTYLKDLDGSKLYLLASDVAGFEKYRYQLDDDLMSGNLTAAFDIYNVYLKRLKDRNAKMLANVDKTVDFKADESYEIDREKKATWAKTPQELDELWRKILKSQLLDYKLNKTSDTTAIKQLKDRYKYAEKVYNRTRSEDVFQEFINAFSHCLDPHTDYYAPRAESDFKMDMQQAYEGIGATLRNEGDYVTIIELNPAGVAFKSQQVKKGDKIVAVAQGEDGPMKDIVGWLTTDAVQLIRGPKGSTVRLQLLGATDPAGTKAREVKLVRDKIKLEDTRAKAEVFPLTYNGRTYNMGVISIPLFYRDFDGANKKESDFVSTTRDVQRFLTDFKTKNVDGVMIDLRNNGGGSLAEAVSLSGLFYSRGPAVQVKYSTGESEVLDDKDPAIAYDGPLAILVNRFSASASEIFAGAIQDYKRGLVIGEKSYGKGTVQTQIELNQFMPQEKEKLGMLKLTVQKFYRVTGSSTQRKGVSPDISFPSGLTPDEYGESSEATALPWDQMTASKYASTDIISETAIKMLQDKYNARLKTDTELKVLVSDAEDFKKQKERQSISLQYDKRLKERNDQEAKRKERDKILGTADEGATPSEPKSKKDKDIYLKEAGRVLIDLAVIQKPDLAKTPVKKQ